MHGWLFQVASDSVCCCCCRASGQSSQERKRGLIGKLLVASKGSEPGYIIRSLQVCGNPVGWCRVRQVHAAVGCCSTNRCCFRWFRLVELCNILHQPHDTGTLFMQAKLRIGLAEQSVLVAIAHAVLLHKDGASDK